MCSGPEGEEGLCAQGLKVRRGCVLQVRMGCAQGLMVRRGCVLKVRRGCVLRAWRQGGAVCSGPAGEEGLCAQGMKVRRGCVLRA